MDGPELLRMILERQTHPKTEAAAKVIIIQKDPDMRHGRSMLWSEPRHLIRRWLSLLVYYLVRQGCHRMTQRPPLCLVQ